MKRFVALVPWMAVTAFAVASGAMSSGRSHLRNQARAAAAHVNYTYLGVSPGEATRIGDECFVAPAMAEGWGWKVTPLPYLHFRLEVDDQTVEITGREINHQPVLPVVEAVRLLDGEARWRPHSDELDVFSRVRVVRFIHGHICVNTSLGVHPTVAFLEKPARIALNFAGAKLSIDLITDLNPGLVVEEPKLGEVRISCPVKRPFVVPAGSTAIGKDFDLDTAPPVANTPPPQPYPIATTGIHLDLENSQSLQISLDLPAQLKQPLYFARVNPTTLRVSVPGIRFALSPDSKIESESVKEAKTIDRPGGTDLMLTLDRPMGVTVSADKKLRIVLSKPPVGDGQLAGKVIVVDAGHGGQDTGATAYGSGIFEKNLTLAIAKDLGNDLAAEGATVIMTRTTDTFITLPERAAIANRNHADLFLCVHINSNGSDQRSSGTITFFHNQDPISSTLAACIQSEIVKTSGIPGIGIWSDTKIHRSGFSVLRNTKMPGVLVECGFINNTHDRRQLVRDDIQAALAASIVRGVKVYLGENLKDEN